MNKKNIIIESSNKGYYVKIKTIGKDQNIYEHLNNKPITKEKALTIAAESAVRLKLPIEFKIIE